MKNRTISKGIHIGVVTVVFVFIAAAASCMRETATLSEDPLSLCTVFADYDVSERSAWGLFDASYADYAHLFNGTADADDILGHRQQRLESLDQLQQHYRQTFVRDLPSLVRDSFEPDWDGWTEWRVFAGKFRSGDELWYFALPKSKVGRGAPRRGYIIVREGRLHAMLVNRTVVFGAGWADYESLLRGVATESQILTWKRQQLESLDAVRQHHSVHFGPDSTRIVLEPRCRLGRAARVPTRWDHWHVFGRRYLPGDQLWYFESPSASWAGPGGRCGYLILRDGELHAMILVAIS